MNLKKLILGGAIFASVVGTALARSAYYVTSCGYIATSPDMNSFTNTGDWLDYCKDLNDTFCKSGFKGVQQHLTQATLNGVDISGTEVYYLY